MKTLLGLIWLLTLAATASANVNVNGEASSQSAMELQVVSAASEIYLHPSWIEGATESRLAVFATVKFGNPCLMGIVKDFVAIETAVDYEERAVSYLVAAKHEDDVHCTMEYNPVVAMIRLPDALLWDENKDLDVQVNGVVAESKYGLIENEDIRIERRHALVNIDAVYIHTTFTEFGAPVKNIYVSGVASNSCFAPSAEETVAVKLSWDEHHNGHHYYLGNGDSKICPMIYQPTRFFLNVGEFSSDLDEQAPVLVNGVSSRQK